MSSTNKTSNYNLPIFVATDKPSWMNDWNTAMNAIDAAIKAASQSGSGGGVTQQQLDAVNATAQSALSTANDNSVDISEITRQLTEQDRDITRANANANSANKTAGEAKTIAQAAQTQANQNEQAIISATTLATNASNTATQAKNTAQTASTTAGTANTTANNAKTTAESAQTTATQAKSQSRQNANAISTLQNSVASLTSAIGSLDTANQNGVALVTANAQNVLGTYITAVTMPVKYNNVTGGADGVMLYFLGGFAWTPNIPSIGGAIFGVKVPGDSISTTQVNLKVCLMTDSGYTIATGTAQFTYQTNGWRLDFSISQPSSFTETKTIYNVGPVIIGLDGSQVR